MYPNVNRRNYTGAAYLKMFPYQLAIQCNTKLTCSLVYHISVSGVYWQSHGTAQSADLSHCCRKQ